MQTKYSVRGLALAIACLALGTGCAEMGGMMELAGKASGNSSLTSAGSSFKRVAEVDDFSEDEKVYTGRTVAANLLADYQLSDDIALEKYVGKVGQGIALASGKATLPQGWHFVLIRDNGTDAFSAPGGIVLVSEGLVRFCQDEDELAGVLAHEVAHIELDHPMQAISASNRKQALVSLASFAYEKAAANSSGGAALSKQFGDVVGEVAKGVTQGYDRSKENEADAEAVRITTDLGYDPHGLERVLRRLTGGDHSHGDPKQRADAVEKTIVAAGDVPGRLAAREQRFKAAVGQ